MLETRDMRGKNCTSNKNNVAIVINMASTYNVRDAYVGERKKQIRNGWLDIEMKQKHTF